MNRTILSSFAAVLVATAAFASPGRARRQAGRRGRREGRRNAAAGDRHRQQDPGLRHRPQGREDQGHVRGAQHRQGAARDQPGAADVRLHRGELRPHDRARRHRQDQRRGGHHRVLRADLQGGPGVLQRPDGPPGQPRDQGRRAGVRRGPAAAARDLHERAPGRAGDAEAGAGVGGRLRLQDRERRRHQRSVPAQLPRAPRQGAHPRPQGLAVGAHRDRTGERSGGDAQPEDHRQDHVAQGARGDDQRDRRRAAGRPGDPGAGRLRHRGAATPWSATTC